MIPARFSISLLLLCMITTQLFAQQQNISGRITDAETRLPIRYAEVFISGTTVGCITDSLGNFTLKVPFLPCTLVADHVAYESFIKPIENCETLNIKLKPQNNEISEISVSGKNKRKRNLRFFYSRFIPDYSNEIKVLNDSVLRFRSDKMEFYATSNEALIIENNYLGYRIKVILKEFKVIALDEPNGKQIPLISPNGGEVIKLSGYYHYEPMERYSGEKANEYRLNRRYTYYGSYRHFLKSIYDNEPEKEGYKIAVFPPETDAAFYQVEDSTLSEARTYIILADLLKVYYRFDSEKFPIPEDALTGRHYFSQRISTIHPQKKTFLIRPNGTSPNLPFVINGTMATKSFANSLPDDYTPPKR